MADKYTATWVSHSSMNDFLHCPRAYFLRNVYKDPHSGHKVQLVTPSLSLGSAVHDVIESLSILSVEERFKQSLLDLLEDRWKKVTGKRGGFLTQDQERSYKQEAQDMIRRVMKDPGPLKHRAVKIKADLPHYWLSQEDEIILCGKIDWLEYLPESDTVHVIDFKTSKSQESESSLQLPIYHLLVHNTQQRMVSKASYWYLRQDRGLVEKVLPDLDQAHKTVLEIAKKIKLQRKLSIFKCSQGESGCFACRPLEKIVRGEAELVGVNDYKQDVYILTSSGSDMEFESEVL